MLLSCFHASTITCSSRVDPSLSYVSKLDKVILVNFEEKCQSTVDCSNFFFKERHKKETEQRIKTLSRNSDTYLWYKKRSQRWIFFFSELPAVTYDRALAGFKGKNLCLVLQSLFTVPVVILRLCLRSTEQKDFLCS